MSDVPGKAYDKARRYAKDANPPELMDLVQMPWPVLCPACGGDGKKQLWASKVERITNVPTLRVAVGFDWNKVPFVRSNAKGRFYVFVCARCDGKGTVVE